MGVPLLTLFSLLITKLFLNCLHFLDELSKILTLALKSLSH